MLSSLCDISSKIHLVYHKPQHYSIWPAVFSHYHSIFTKYQHCHTNKKYTVLSSKRNQVSHEYTLLYVFSVFPEYNATEVEDFMEDATYLRILYMDGDIALVGAK